MNHVLACRINNNRGILETYINRKGLANLGLSSLYTFHAGAIDGGHLGQFPCLTFEDLIIPDKRDCH